MGQYDIFISHDSKDKKVAGELKSFLEDVFSDVDVYVSGQKLRGGQTWYTEIVKALKESKVVISLISRNSINNNWVYFETGAGAVEGKSVPLLSDGIEFDDLAKYPIGNIQARKFDNQGIPQLIEDVATFVELKRKPKNIGNIDELIDKCNEHFLEIEVENLEPELEALNFTENDDEFEDSNIENNTLHDRLENELETASIHLKNHWIKLANEKYPGGARIHPIQTYGIPKLYEYLQSIGITSQATNYSDFIKVERLALSPTDIETKNEALEKLDTIQKRISLKRI